MTTITHPQQLDLAALARRHRRAAAASTWTRVAGDVVTASPINGERGRRSRWADARRRRRGRRAGAGRVPVAPGAGARPWRPGQAARRAARRAQGRPRHPGQHRGRQDHLRGARRGPGDDRHLRLRGRPVAPALRPDHALRAPRPPADGDLAPARRGRRDLRVQLPGGGVVVEHRGRAGLRRPRGLEAVGVTPLTSLACHAILPAVAEHDAPAPSAGAARRCGVGQALVDHPESRS